MTRIVKLALNENNVMKKNRISRMFGNKKNNREGGSEEMTEIECDANCLSNKEGRCKAGNIKVKEIFHKIRTFRVCLSYQHPDAVWREEPP